LATIECLMSCSALFSALLQGLLPASTPLHLLPPLLLFCLTPRVSRTAWGAKRNGGHRCCCCCLQRG
jgi:hypothetical protein